MKIFIMQKLTNQAILATWEIGAKQHPIDQALTLLQLQDSTQSRHDLATLSLGERNQLLLDFYQTWFGNKVSGHVGCQNCGELLALDVNSNIFKNLPKERHQSLRYKEFDINFRLLTSYDLAEIANYQDVEQASNKLIQSCITSVEQHGEAVWLDEIPEELLIKLSNTVVACDPYAEILLMLKCPNCEYSQQIVIDFGQLLWRKFEQLAVQLLEDIQRLAAYYHWREQDIIAMPALRRHFYLSRT